VHQEGQLNEMPAHEHCNVVQGQSCVDNNAACNIRRQGCWGDR